MKKYYVEINNKEDYHKVKNLKANDTIGSPVLKFKTDELYRDYFSFVAEMLYKNDEITKNIDNLKKLGKKDIL